jgi:hypothetical protein
MEKHLPCQSPSDSAQPFLEGSSVILFSNEVLKGMRRVFLAWATSAQLPLVPPNRSRKMRRSSGRLGFRMGTCSRLRRMERTGDPMSRARSRLVVHIIYECCTFAAGQFCSVLGSILTGNILERIESLPCRVLATTVVGSQQGSPVGHCPLQHENESQRLRKRVGQTAAEK